MTILANELGFREIQRLITFIDLMINYNPSDCIESTFSYDMHYDEPTITLDNGEWFLASDYNIAFDSDNRAEFI